MGWFNVDGDIATDNANFNMAILTFKGATASMDDVTSTTIDGNASEFNSIVNFYVTLENMSSLINNQIQVYVTSEKRQIMLLQLFNEQGRLVRHKQINGDAGLNLIELDNVQQLSAGAYFLRLKSDGLISTRKLIKQ